MMLRIRHRQLGAHVYCRIFTSQTHSRRDFAKNGEMVLTTMEFEALKRLIVSRRIEFVPEEDAHAGDVQR